jgi:hypothetical protein
MAKNQSNQKVLLDGGNQIVLRQEHYLVTGGEASLYRVGGIIIKIYTDETKMRRDHMDDKIRLLMKLNHPYIVAPLGLVYADGGNSIGYYMNYVQGEPFSRVFTNAFWQRNKFTVANVSKLVEKMRDLMIYVHSQGFSMVDPNEMNWLMVSNGKGNPEPRIIDVDSWSNARWPAKVIMPSIRDWHSKDFGEMSDWFAWGVVTFQLYTGIHPYKGTLVNYKMSDLEQRMKDNASVFSGGVRLNRAVRDFSKIPAVLLQWYEEVFQNGNRSIPPSPFATAVKPRSSVQSPMSISPSTGALRLDKILSVRGDELIKGFFCGVALSQSGTLYEIFSGRKIGKASSSLVEIVQFASGWLKVDVENGELIFSYIDRTSLAEIALNFHLKQGACVSFENRLFVLSSGLLAEVSLRFLSKPILFVKNNWQVLESATEMMFTCFVENVMGAKYLLIPFDESSLAHLRVRELDSVRVIQARHGNRFVALTVLDKRGDYYSVELVLSADCTSYSWKQELVDSPELNIVVLPKRVCAKITEDSFLEIFVPGTDVCRKLEDSNISGLMSLFNVGDKVCCLWHNELYSLTMK